MTHRTTREGGPGGNPPRTTGSSAPQHGFQRAAALPHCWVGRQYVDGVVLFIEHRTGQLAGRRVEIRGQKQSKQRDQKRKKKLSKTFGRLVEKLTFATPIKTGVQNKKVLKFLA